MIENININYRIDGIDINISIADDEIENNLPYNLGNMFSRLVKDTNANPALVIEGMKQWLEVEE